MKLAHLLACSFSALVLSVSATAQESVAPMDAAVVQLTEDDVPFRRLFDFDDDGDLDAVGIYPHQDRDRFRTAVYENDGTGAFEEVWFRSYVLDDDANKFSIETGRLNDDALDDFSIIAGNERFDLISLGNGNWSEFQYVLAAQTRDLALRDLDGDGIDDHVYVDNNNLRVWVRGNELSIPVGAGQPKQLRVLDADGDPYLDVFVSVNAQIRVWHGSANGLVPGTTYALGLHSFLMDVGDVDGDLDTDVVIFQMSDPPEYKVLRRTGPATWNLESELVGGPAEFLRDVDGDGDLDGVCCGGGGPGTPPYKLNDERTDFQIALNDGSGNFDVAFQIEGLGSPQLAGVADVDNDGDTDLVAGRCVYFARGPIVKPHTQAEGFDMPSVASTRGVVDFDEDGDTDVGLCLTHVWVNDGTGFFERQAPTVQAAPRNTAFRGPGFPGDFDGDGLTDLLVEHRSLPRGATPGGQLVGNARLPGLLIGSRFLRNDGSGAFLDGGPASPRRSSLALDSLVAEASVLGDLDADGDLDLIARTMTYTPESQAWLNDGSGFFLPLQRIPGERVEHVKDLDLDGVPDLVTTHDHDLFTERETLGVLRGSLSQGNIPGYMDLSDLLFDFPYSINGRAGAALEDFTGDGFFDLAIVVYPGSAASRVQLMIDRQGFGEVGYSANVAIDPGVDLLYEARVSAGDIDGDGSFDALVSGVSGGPHLSVISIKQPDPSWFFTTRTVQIIPPGVLADVDGDGDLDVVGDGVVFNVMNP